MTKQELINKLKKRLTMKSVTTQLAGKKLKEDIADEVIK